MIIIISSIFIQDLIQDCNKFRHELPRSIPNCFNQITFSKRLGWWDVCGGVCGWDPWVCWKLRFFVFLGNKISDIKQLSTKTVYLLFNSFFISVSVHLELVNTVRWETEEEWNDLAIQKLSSDKIIHINDKFD